MGHVLVFLPLKPCHSVPDCPRAPPELLEIPEAIGLYVRSTQGMLFASWEFDFVIPLDGVLFFGAKPSGLTKRERNPCEFQKARVVGYSRN